MVKCLQEDTVTTPTAKSTETKTCGETGKLTSDTRDPGIERPWLPIYRLNNVDQNPF